MPHPYNDKLMTKIFSSDIHTYINERISKCLNKTIINRKMS